jgi:hypothetical protein
MLRPLNKGGRSRTTGAAGDEDAEPGVEDDAAPGSGSVLRAADMERKEGRSDTPPDDEDDESDAGVESIIPTVEYHSKLSSTGRRMEEGERGSGDREDGKWEESPAQADGRWLMSCMSELPPLPSA